MAMHSIQIDKYNSLSDRDRQIVDSFLDEKLTMEEIGNVHGLTRARVQQILAGVGIRGREIQAIRTQEAALRREQKIASLASDIALDSADLVNKGLTSEEIDEVLPFLVPGEAVEDLKIAFDKVRNDQGLTVARASGRTGLSREAVEAALYFILARHLDLPTDRMRPASVLSRAVMLELPAMLSRQGLDRGEVFSVLQAVAAGMEADDLKDRTLSASQYNTLREEFLSQHGLESERGSSLWPVSSQTIMARLDGWNEALDGLGLETNEAPEGFGESTYSPEDYEQAIQDFKESALEKGFPPVLDRYREWVVLEADEGRRRPSAEAVRGAYGSWSQAMQADGNSSLVERPSDRRRARRAREAAESAEQELLYAKEDEIDRIDEQIDARREALAARGGSSAADEELTELEYRKERLAAERDALADSAARWKQQLARWAENDRQAAADRKQQDEQMKVNERQNRINLILSIAVAAGSFVVPLLVWWLETFGPRGN